MPKKEAARDPSILPERGSLPAPCSVHPSPWCLPIFLHSVLPSASSHSDDSLEKRWLP